MAEPRVELRWIDAQAFGVRSPEGAAIAIDGDAKRGLSPMQTLLASVAGCMGIDVVSILTKMRSAPEAFAVEVEGDRTEGHPRRYTALRLRFRVTGDVPRDKAERAVALSFEKYCSVFHTLRQDMDVSTEIEILAPR